MTEKFPGNWDTGTGVRELGYGNWVRGTGELGTGNLGTATLAVLWRIYIRPRIIHRLQSFRQSSIPRLRPEKNPAQLPDHGLRPGPDRLRTDLFSACPTQELRLAQVIPTPKASHEPSSTCHRHARSHLYCARCLPRSLFRMGLTAYHRRRSSSPFLTPRAP